jgi:hypothetical protein
MSKQHLKQVSPLTWIYVDEPKTMSNKKQSSVEWLYERLERMIPRTTLYNIDKKQFLEQAKAMHKEEIEVAYIQSMKDNMIAPLDFEVYKPEGEEYYNETFGGQDNE